MTPWWRQLVKRFSRQAVNEEKTVSPKHSDFDKVVDDARKAWLQARHHFENVTDPDLIDHAIYDIVATERKYMYLLRLAREERRAVEIEPELEQDCPTDQAEPIQVEPMEPQMQVAQLESTRQSS